MDAAGALSAKRDGQTFYFCSEHCRNEFVSQLQPNEPTAPTATDAEEHTHCGDQTGEHRHGKEHLHNHNEHGKPARGAKYFCPMDRDAASDKPGSCPKCGMALERNPSWAPETHVTYTCPMHPEVQEGHPGNCPICGMALEPRTATAETEEQSSETKDMTRRFWVALVLSIPVLVLGMGHLIPGFHLEHWIPPKLNQWLQFLLATSVVLWCGWPFLVRGVNSVRTWRLNMFTLISLGVGAAYLSSVAALLVPSAFPADF